MRSIHPRMIVSVALAGAVGLSTVPSLADEVTSRWVAALPFGAGQIHRGDVGLGLFFAASEGVLGGMSIAAAAMYGSLNSAGHDPHVNIRALNAELRTASMVNRMAFASWAALAVAGVFEAQVNVGRVSSSRDKQSTTVRVTAAPISGGAAISLHLSL